MTLSSTIMSKPVQMYAKQILTFKMCHIAISDRVVYLETKYAIKSIEAIILCHPPIFPIQLPKVFAICHPQKHCITDPLIGQ